MAAITAAIIGAAVIGAGSTLYASKKADDAAEKEEARLALAEEERKAEAERIAKETRPEGEAVASVEFGFGGDKEMGSTSDFLIPKSGAALGGTGSSGLGFSV